MRSYPQQGVEGTDGRYLRRDGSLVLTANWNAGAYEIRNTYFVATAGGVVVLGNTGGVLRIIKNASEIVEILGVSNNQAILYLKNLRVGDLAGVGNRNVIADVNGDLSAP